MTAAEIAALIGSGRYDLTDERACQADIDTLLAASLPDGMRCRREARLGPGDIPDFVIDGRFVVEVKMGRAQPRAVLRQLGRYGAYLGIEALILVTNKAMAVPGEVGGKPVHVVSLGQAWL